MHERTRTHRQRHTGTRTHARARTGWKLQAVHLPTPTPAPTPTPTDACARHVTPRDQAHRPPSKRHAMAQAAHGGMATLVAVSAVHAAAPNGVGPADVIGDADGSRPIRDPRPAPGSVMLHGLRAPVLDLVRIAKRQ
jgi:hypothetical protein